jgi:Lar family restriction alleviation protein
MSNRPGLDSTSSAAELAPCPFCGSKRIVVNTMLMDNDWFGHCLDCGAKGPTDLAMDRAEATRLWNRRVHWSEEW